MSIYSIYSLIFTTLLIFCCITLVIKIIIGVFVYKDASRKGLTAGLWTLLSVFMPFFIGLAVYLSSTCKIPYKTK